ncbi:MAG: N-acetylmuramoyl-L-alanine amidase [Planctomycetes bacterium]|nr:N-acetylmuramoyl-L-alanine amidase [Planctomycetota bacterium]
MHARLLALGLGLGLFALGACRAPQSLDRGPSDDGLRRGAPAWVGAEEGWDKLERIERWLASGADGYDAYWRLQGELALAEGRLAFARTEQGSAAALGGRWDARLESARAGFERVTQDAEASPSQRERARRGLASLGVLDGAGDAPAAAPSGMLSRSAWGASRPVAARLDRTTGGYDKITVHHTAQVPGARFDGSLADSVETVRRVQGEHMSNRGYGDIGYHFLIDAAGRVFAGRDLAWQGAHAGGVRNKNNIGICLLGNFETGRPSDAAMAALTQLVADLRRTHHIERDGIYCHKELKNTECPGPHLAAWASNYRRGGPSLASLGGSARPTARPADARVSAARPVSAASSACAHGRSARCLRGPEGSRRAARVR